MARYGVVVYWPDAPTAGEQILLHAVAAQATFAEGMSESRALLDTAATASTTFSIQLNGDEKATVTFPAAGTVGAFTCASSWVARPGDKLEIFAPDPADATAAGIALTVMGIQAESDALVATLTASASVKATMDHIYLIASLECEADIGKARLNLGNLFPNTILRADANLVTAYLTEIPSFRTDITPEGGSELNAFLTVTRDPSLFF